MRIKKKKKIVRHLNIFKHRLVKAGNIHVDKWVLNNLRQHPFIDTAIFIVWLNEILRKGLLLKFDALAILKFHALLLAIWLILVILSNPLKDFGKIPWYLKKRFVFFMLFLFPPFGLVLLWVGARFKFSSKIVLTIISLSILFTPIILNTKHREKFFNKNSIEAIVEMIRKEKRKVYLRRFDLAQPIALKITKASSNNKMSITEIAARFSPATVSIKTKDKNGREIGLGSGFILTEDGFIVTNLHVLESAYDVELKIGEEVYKDIYFVKGIPYFDIALLKIDARDLPVAAIGDSNELIVGQTVVVLGNPWGFERTVSSGVVSALRSKANMKLIQTTAPVSPGSSGGPVVNEYGEVVGITTAAFFFMAQNLNFAIPINYLSELSNYQ